MSALRSTIARVITMAVSLVCGILSSRLILGEAGVATYALVSLVIALPSLIGFSDLGAGAVIVNSVAITKDIRNDLPLRRQATTVARVILMFAGTVAIIDVILFLTGGWRLVLGNAGSVPQATLATFVCVLIYCVTVSLGLWQRVLLGLGRNPIVILLQGLISPLALLIVWILLTVGDPGLRSFLSLGTFLATVTVAVIGTVVADRLSAPLLRVVAAEVLHPRRYPGARVMDVGWPMFAQLLASPLSLTLPRYILAQSASHTALAQYALAGQVFFALQALIGAAGLTLWPSFAKARAAGRVTRGPFRISVIFGVSAAAVTLVVLVISPWFFAIVSKNEVVVPTALVLAFGLMTTFQAVLYPLGMFIMDKPGIRFQVAPALLMAVSTVVITILTAPSLGVISPLLANAVSVLVFQIVPFIIYIRRNRGRLYSPTPQVISATTVQPPTNPS
jgi:O-antigen/teichoic acid export membrane protein